MGTILEIDDKLMECHDKNYVTAYTIYINIYSRKLRKSMSRRPEHKKDRKEFRSHTINL